MEGGEGAWLRDVLAVLQSLTEGRWSGWASICAIVKLGNWEDGKPPRDTHVLGVIDEHTQCRLALESMQPLLQLLRILEVRNCDQNNVSRSE